VFWATQAPLPPLRAPLLPLQDLLHSPERNQVMQDVAEEIVKATLNFLLQGVPPPMGIQQ
jgi:hypothetical protein